MSRCKKRNPRQIIPDVRYNSELISKFVNMLMYGGNKETCYNIVYSALEIAGKKIKEKYGDIKDGFKEVILLVGPTVQTKVRRIGGANYQVPMEVPDYRRVFMGMKILIKASRKKKGIPMDKALANEIMDAMDEKGEAYKEKITIQKMALANKAYSHLA